MFFFYITLLNRHSGWISTCEVSMSDIPPNEMNRALGHLCAKLGQENLLRMVRWLRWHCPPDTGFEIRALTVWGRARYLSVTEAPHNTDFHTWMGKKHFCFFQTAETGNRTPNSGVKGSCAKHYPRAPT